MAHPSPVEYVLGLTATGWAAVSAITAIIVGVGAIASAILLMRQLRLSTETSQLEEGWNLWSEYLHAVIAHPEARDAASVRAAAGLTEIHWERAATESFSLTTQLVLNRYRALIECFLNAADGLLAGPSAAKWRREIAEHSRRYSPDLLALWLAEGWGQRFNAKLKVIVEASDAVAVSHA